MDYDNDYISVMVIDMMMMCGVFCLFFCKLLIVLRHLKVIEGDIKILFIGEA